MCLALAIYVSQTYISVDFSAESHIHTLPVHVGSPKLAEARALDWWLQWSLPDEIQAAAQLHIETKQLRHSL